MENNPAYSWVIKINIGNTGFSDVLERFLKVLKKKHKIQSKVIWMALIVLIITGLFVWKNYDSIVSVSDYSVKLIWDTEELNEDDMVFIHYLKDGQWICEAKRQFQDDSFELSQEFLEAESIAVNFEFEDEVPETLHMKAIGIFYRNHLIEYLENETVTDSIEKMYAMDLESDTSEGWYFQIGE